MWASARPTTAVAGQPCAVAGTRVSPAAVFNRTQPAQPGPDSPKVVSCLVVYCPGFEREDLDINEPVVEGYKDLKRVAKGGFGVVYRATQTRHDRVVALKVLDLGELDQPAVDRFERECRAMGSLSWHPHVVALLDSGLTGEGLAYLAMEYLEKGSLEVRLRGGPLTWQDAVVRAIEVAGALDVAHEAGTLHRDLKPANMLIGPYGETKLGDFGIAAVEDAARTTTGRMSFTVAHVAPEVLRGHRPDRRSDIYGLASTVHTLIAGRPPFVGDAGEPVATQMMRVLESAPARLPPDTPDDLVAILLRAMAKEPDARQASAAAFGLELQAFQQSLDLAMTPLRLDPSKRVTDPDTDGEGEGAEVVALPDPDRAGERRGDSRPTVVVAAATLATDGDQRETVMVDKTLVHENALLSDLALDEADVGMDDQAGPASGDSSPGRPERRAAESARDGAKARSGSPASAAGATVASCLVLASSLLAVSGLFVSIDAAGFRVWSDDPYSKALVVILAGSGGVLAALTLRARSSGSVWTMALAGFSVMTTAFTVEFMLHFLFAAVPQASDLRAGYYLLSVAGVLDLSAACVVVFSLHRAGVLAWDTAWSRPLAMGALAVSGVYSLAWALAWISFAGAPCCSLTQGDVAGYSIVAVWLAASAAALVVCGTGVRLQRRREGAAVVAGGAIVAGAFAVAAARVIAVDRLVGPAGGFWVLVAATAGFVALAAVLGRLPAER